MQSRIRALRLENKQQRANIDAWNAEVLKEEELLKRWEMEQADDQKKDFGFGEAGVDSKWLDYGDDKDLFGKMDQDMWNEGKDFGSATDKWAEWDAQMERNMEQEDVDY
eukprot:gene245-13709_t